MKDRIIEAMAAAEWTAEHSVAKWETAPSVSREPYIKRATAAFTAALEVMKEPSDEMIRVFVDNALRGDVLSHGGWAGYARDQWQAMLAAME